MRYRLPPGDFHFYASSAGGEIAFMTGTRQPSAASLAALACQAQ